jgi:hypothetical protein
LEPWLSGAMKDWPQQISDIKLTSVRSFAQTLRRYTSLNHLAQVNQMLWYCLTLGGGVKSYEREKGWPSINHSLLSIEESVEDGGKDHGNPSICYFSMIYCSVDCGILPISHFVIRGGAMITITRHSHVVCNRQIYNIRQSFSGGLLGFHSITVFRGMKEQKRTYKVQIILLKKLAGWVGRVATCFS